MLTSLFSSAFKSPVKLLALCLAAYIAAHSIIVFVFMAIAAVHHFKSSAKGAPRQSDRDTADRHDVDESPRHAKSGPVTTAKAEAQAPAVPQRQYAKSAVVIPIKASSNRTNAQHLKTGTK